jgi:hypothetical protein
VIVEEGLRTHTTALERNREPGPTAGLQVALWQDIAGKWEDDRTAAEIVTDIRRNRTPGREVRL